MSPSSVPCCCTQAPTTSPISPATCSIARTTTLRPNASGACPRLASTIPSLPPCNRRCQRHCAPSWSAEGALLMPLVSLSDQLRNALRDGYGVGYFEAWDSYSLEAVLEAAEEEAAPVILGFGGMMADSGWLDNGGVELLGARGRVVAERARVPVSLLLNEAQTFDQAVRGMEAGFNAVMLDTSVWGWGEATEAVARLTRLAHARGVTVEAEVGRLPGATEDGIDAS